MIGIYSSIKGMSIVVLGLVLFDFSCGRSSEQAFTIDTTSPQGIYRVMLDGNVEPSNSLPGEFYVQKVRLVASKGSKVILTSEQFYREDPYEPAFREAFPIYEWTNSHTLRLGNKSSEPFHDEIVISNNSKGNIDLLIIRYGKYERFLIFDLVQGYKLQLQGSPQFDTKIPASKVYYAAYANGRTFEGSTGDSPGRKTDDGPLTIVVDVGDIQKN